MPVSNSFHSLSKFASRATMHHKVNYITAEGMSGGLYNRFRFKFLEFLHHLPLLLKSFEIDVDEVLLF